MKPVWGLFAILVVVMAISVVSKWLAPREIIPWRTDFASARQEAAESGKPVFLYFTASWCVPCQSLKTTTWADASVERELQKFVPVKVDVDHSPELAEQYAIYQVPTMILLDVAGQPVRITSGALTARRLLDWLDGAGNEEAAAR